MTGSAADRDPSWAALRRESARLLRRARRRAPLVFGLSALATLAAAGVASRRPIRQSATVTLRMTEDVRAPIQLPWTDRALRGFVNEVALSQTQLLRVIDAHHLFRGPGKFDPIAAVEVFRERINVDVVQNHAIALVERDNRPRSAHVQIEYQDANPERALVIARELGQLLVETGLGQQRQQSESAVRAASAEAVAARAALERLRVEAASSTGLFPAQARSFSDIPGMKDAIRLAQGRLDRADEALTNAERRLRGESEQSGLNIELLDTHPAPPPWPAGKRLAVVAATASLLCLPLAMLMVGAWDRRIYAAEDLRHLGVRCLGQLGLTKKEV
jgi:hypothetical protein